MRPQPWMLLAAFVALVGAAGLFNFSSMPLQALRASAWSEKPAVPPAEVQPGITAAEVVKRLGKPQRTARQILYHRYLEQWTYDGPEPLWIELECLKGQEPRVLTVHALPSAKP